MAEGSDTDARPCDFGARVVKAQPLKWILSNGIQLLVCGVVDFMGGGLHQIGRVTFVWLDRGSAFDSRCVVVFAKNWPQM
jgi:hypothetical protein